MGLSDGLEIDVTDDPDEYARRIVALATDSTLWTAREALEARVREWESQRTSWADVIARVLAREMVRKLALS